MTRMKLDEAAENTPRRNVLVAIIDPNPLEREQYAQALTAFYQVVSYPNFESAFSVLTLLQPSILLLDEKVRPGGEGPLVRSVRAMPMFKDTPIILSKMSGILCDPVMAADLPDIAPDAVLEKPFRRSILLNTIAALLNDEIEARWATLPLNTKLSLQLTLKTFNHIATLVEQGAELPQTELDKACAPLVDAILNSEYRHLMDGVTGHSNFTYVHSVRVSALLVMLGYALGLHQAALRVLAVAGFVHDIGKMAIPENILNKVGTLTGTEKMLCRNHAENGVKYLQRHAKVPKGVMTVVSNHHERLDGSGYPLRLKAPDLNELARMSAIVDVYAAMTEYRPYKQPFSPEEAMDCMCKEMSGQLDMHLLHMFRGMLLDASFAASRDAPSAISQAAAAFNT